MIRRLIIQSSGLSLPRLAVLGPLQQRISLADGQKINILLATPRLKPVSSAPNITQRTHMLRPKPIMLALSNLTEALMCNNALLVTLPIVQVHFAETIN